ncbi:Thioredoxin reductase [Anatilimnocola aggregata]|uniref:Thioredoxin reductase n=1 Tax=Anatilimnocola aggregata TaxID=2528021 RepID=A0A517YEG0_9BACT|nr:thioredoxin-disulfide reductase [Anatilimnocola aggregata]QDU28614.1 Thioredoxin reductase [Anatilimnocola aggregata]
MPEHVVIIGSGPAGWSAAIYAARANLHPIVFEGAITEENRISGTLPLGQLNLTTEVENYAGFPSGNLSGYIKSAIDPERHNDFMIEEHPHAVTGPELMNLMRQQALNFGTKIVTDDVVSVDLSKRPFVITPREGEPIESHTIIVSTGARANYLGLPSEEKFKNRGVSACAVCDGALPRFRNKPMVVVGGGDSAVEEATYLSKYASTVHMLMRRDVFRASKIMKERAETNPKIKIHFFREVDEVLGDDKPGGPGVTGIRLKNNQDGTKEELAASGLFLAIGHTPNTSFLNGQLELNEKGYVKLTQSFRTYTSVPGVFAAGDVADDYYRQAITSAGTGCMAALDAERFLAAEGI